MEDNIKIKFRQKINELRNNLAFLDELPDFNPANRRSYVKFSEAEEIVNDFLKENQFNHKDYLNYFEKECMNLTQNDIEGFEIHSDSPSIIDFICEIQKHVVKVHMIKTIKERFPVIQTPFMNHVNLN